MTDPLAPVPEAAPPTGVGAAPAAPPGAAEAQQQINAIYADKSHPYHKGDRGATTMVADLFRKVHGDAPVPDGPPLGPDPEADLRGPEEVAVLRDFGAGFAAAGLPRDYSQAIVDFTIGARATLPAAPPEYIPPTADEARAALIGLEGPARAQQTIAKAEAVFASLQRISPEVADRLAYVVGASRIGNLVSTVQKVAALYDLAPEAQQQLVRAYFGPRAADTLFGPGPRR